MPAHLETTEHARRPAVVAAGMSLALRLGLLVLAILLSTVLGLAMWLKPYDADGQPLEMGTHLQLGLPQCTFLKMTDMPCPSCGMTTSFALLLRGDVMASLRANAVGTLLAIFFMMLIPWSLACVLLKRTVFIRSLELALMWAVLVFLGLLMTRWVIVVGLSHWLR